MVDALLDTSMLIDLLREHPPAAEWIANEEKIFGITKFAWMEVVTGCRNKRSLLKATRLIERFELIPVATSDVDWALNQLTKYYLSHNPDPFDCLIAATPARLQIPLYTLNLKHFRPLLGELAQKPYS